MISFRTAAQAKVRISRTLKASSYEDHHDLVIEEINKRRGKWFLTSVAWMDFDDVKQMISAHIHSKWGQYNPSKPLKPWVNKIITNQMKNILRNNYSNFVRPCLSCPFNLNSESAEKQGDCSFTKSGNQDSSCPLFKKWEKTKKSAYDIKMAISIDGASHEAHSITQREYDIISAERRLHAEMKLQLGERQYKVYDLLFVQHKDENEVARIMGYKTSESGRRAGYKQIKNLKKQFKEKAKKIMSTKDIFIDETGY